MTLTLDIQPQDEAQAVRELVGDLRSSLLLRMKRPNITAARIVGVGKLLNIFNEIEQQLPPEESQPEGAAAMAAIGA